MTPRLVRAAKQVRALLDALFALCMVVILAETFLSRAAVQFRGLDLLTFHAIRLAMAMLAGCMWLGIRQTGRIGWLVGLWVLALLCYTMNIVEPLTLVIIVMFVVGGPRAGYRAAALLALVATALVFIPGVFPVIDRIYLAMRNVLVLATPVLIGSALRRLQESAQSGVAANRELAEANARLREQGVQEVELLLADERARAARELHDGLGQQLTLAGMSLDYVDRALHSDPAAWDEVAQARELVAQAARDVRSDALTCGGLAPRRLGLVGLPAILDSFRSAGLDVVVEASELELGQRLELFVTRFVQEGLTNALRHGRATGAVLRLWVANDVLDLQLTSNGHCPTHVQEGFGLRSLRERAEELGGEFEVATESGEFVIRARLPRTVLCSSTAESELVA